MPLQHIRRWQPWPRSVFWAASPQRALVETLLLQAPLLLWALLVEPHASFFTQLNLVGSLVVVAGPVAILWCVFRMRRPARPWWVRVAIFSGMGLTLALTPTTMLVILWRTVNARGGPNATVGLGRFPLPNFIGAWLLAFTLAFLVSRLGARLVYNWNSLRRTHLVWSLTHAHLLVVVLGAGVLSVALVMVDLARTGSVALRVVPGLFVIFIVTVAMLLIVLPPSALFSYLFAQRTTRRLETLADATSVLRGGDYTVRIPVEGEDEVAQLQADFNAMAADLERAHQALRAERDTVATLLRSRRELVASVSHELRTPVATLRSYLESTRIHWDGTSPATLPHDLEVMERETIRLQSLINDLFTLSRAEVGRLEVRTAPTDVGALAQHCIETMAPLAWQSGRVEVFARPTHQLPLALVDAGRLEQVLQNLLHNAIRHTSPGGIVAIECVPEGAMLALHVRDTGEGIAAEDLPHIWERFYRSDMARLHPESGSGLGLALVKELTEAMGGSVGVESTLGVGSCFTVWVPRAEPGTVALDASRTRATDRPHAAEATLTS